MLVSSWPRLQRPNLGEGPVERGEVGGGELGHEVPSAVGGMHAADLGHAAERRQDGAGIGGADLDRHNRPHPAPSPSLPAVR